MNNKQREGSSAAASLLSSESFRGQFGLVSRSGEAAHGSWAYGRSKGVSVDSLTTLFLDSVLCRPGLNILWDYACIDVACFIGFLFPG